MGIFSKDLRVGVTSRQGWILYLTKAMDHGVLSKAISEEIGEEVVMRFKYISTDKYEPDTAARKK